MRWGRRIRNFSRAWAEMVFCLLLPLKLDLTRDIFLNEKACLAAESQLVLAVVVAPGGVSPLLGMQVPFGPFPGVCLRPLQSVVRVAPFERQLLLLFEILWGFPLFFSCELSPDFRLPLTAVPSKNGRFSLFSPVRDTGLRLWFY